MLNKDELQPLFRLDMPFSEALARFAQTKPEEISLNANKIKELAPKMPSKEIGPKATQGSLIPVAEKDVGGIGMGVLSDGTPYLNQRGLAALCGVQNAHIGTISSQWGEAAQVDNLPATHWPRAQHLALFDVTVAKPRVSRCSIRREVE